MFSWLRSAVKSGNATAFVKPVVVSLQPAIDPQVKFRGSAYHKYTSGQEIFIDDAEGHEIAAGGEGRICRTSEKGVVAKLYKAEWQAKATRDSYDKLCIQATFVPSVPTLFGPTCTLAWPIDVVLKNGTPCGFLMPHVDTDALQEVFAVSNVHFRKKQLETFSADQFRQWKQFTWFQQHLAALQLAMATAELHDKGFLVKDWNPNNFFVSPNGDMTLVDCDSFVTPRPTGGTIHNWYMFERNAAPEVRTPRRATCFTAKQDVYGLAVIIFQLLTNGHPEDANFTGPDGQPIYDSVGKGLYVYSPSAEKAPIIPPPDVLFPRVKEHFDRCFIEGATNPNARPSAREWITALEEALFDLVQCKSNPFHWHRNSMTCYWCNDGVARYPRADKYDGTGVDAIDSAILASLVQAITQNNELEIARILENTPSLAANVLVSKHSHNFARAWKRIQLLNGWIAASRQHSSSIRDVLRQYPAELRGSEIERRFKINNLTVLEILRGMQIAVEHADEFHDLVKRKDSAPHCLSSEREILRSWEQGRSHFEYLGPEVVLYRERAERARQWIERYERRCANVVDISRLLDDRFTEGIRERIEQLSKEWPSDGEIKSLFDLLSKTEDTIKKVNAIKKAVAARCFTEAAALIIQANGVLDSWAPEVRRVLSEDGGWLRDAEKAAARGDLGTARTICLRAIQACADSRAQYMLLQYSENGLPFEHQEIVRLEFDESELLAKLPRNWQQQATMTTVASILVISIVAAVSLLSPSPYSRIEAASISGKISDAQAILRNKLELGDINRAQAAKRFLDQAQGHLELAANIESNEVAILEYQNAANFFSLVVVCGDTSHLASQASCFRNISLAHAENGEFGKAAATAIAAEGLYLEAEQYFLSIMEATNGRIRASDSALLQNSVNECKRRSEQCRRNTEHWKAVGAVRK